MIRIGGRLGLPPHVITDYTFREIDAFAAGHDYARRAQMATAVWQAWNTAAYVGRVWGGKRLPNIDRRIHEIMNPAARRADGVGDVIAKMREVSARAGMPPPKKRKN